MGGSRCLLTASAPGVWVPASHPFSSSTAATEPKDGKDAPTHAEGSAQSRPEANSATDQSSSSSSSEEVVYKGTFSKPLKRLKASCFYLVNASCSLPKWQCLSSICLFICMSGWLAAGWLGGSNPKHSKHGRHLQMRLHSSCFCNVLDRKPSASTKYSKRRPSPCTLSTDAVSS